MTETFYDGRSPQPLPVEVVLSLEGLDIRRPDGSPVSVWPREEIVVADRRDDVLVIMRREGDARLRIMDPPLMATLIAAIRPHARWRSTRAVALWTAVALLLLGAGTLGAVFVWPAAADRIAGAIPDAWLDPIGQTAIRSISDRSKTCSNPEGRAALDRLLIRLGTTADRAKPQVIVIGRPVRNAFAVPDNHIVLLAGLLQQAEHPNEIAGILAHEIGHLEYRHSARMLVRQLGGFFLVEMLTGGSSLGGFGATAVALSYSRDFERDADDFSRRVLAHAGIDARPVGGFFERLAKEEGGLLTRGLDYLGTHPASTGRAAAFAAAEPGGPAMSEADFTALKKICD